MNDDPLGPTRGCLNGLALLALSSLAFWLLGVLFGMIGAGL